MHVVIFGARNRQVDGDYELVNKLIDQLKSKYAKLDIISGGCDRGIGKYVKNRCRPKELGQHQGEVQFFDVDVHIYADDLSKAHLGELWRARNAMFYEYGEEFHIFTDDQKSGIPQDLIARCAAGGRPYAVYYMGEKTDPKEPGIGPEEKFDRMVEGTR